MKLKRVSLLLQMHNDEPGIRKLEGPYAGRETYIAARGAFAPMRIRTTGLSIHNACSSGRWSFKGLVLRLFVKSNASLHCPHALPPDICLHFTHRTERCVPQASTILRHESHRQPAQHRRAHDVIHSVRHFHAR